VLIVPCLSFFNPNKTNPATTSKVAAILPTRDNPEKFSRSQQGRSLVTPYAPRKMTT
jgi:hypothetical protein